MAAETLHQEEILKMLKPVPASSVPVPGAGPVLFADSSNSGALTMKSPDGTTKVIFAQATPPEVEGDPDGNEALINLLAALATAGIIVDSTA